MSLHLPDKWIWDFWLVQDGPDYHAFYLQAPRSLGDPELRHWNCSVGHAVSSDLKAWQILPDALQPSPWEAWDDYTTWTGSIINHAGLWYFFYTGSSRAEKGLVQRIGLATSTDLIKWEKHPANPLIEADPQWYEQLDLKQWGDQAWRDPWLFQHPESGEFHAFITGRVNYGPPDERGVIAHARSTDLLRWEVLPPVSEPGHFGQLEVPQLMEIEGRYYLIFCSTVKTHAARWREYTGLAPVTGTHYLIGDNPLGPFHLSNNQFFAGDEIGSLYAGKLVKGPNGDLLFMAWRLSAPDGKFIGELSDPYPVKVEPDGSLSIKA